MAQPPRTHDAPCPLTLRYRRASGSTALDPNRNIIPHGAGCPTAAPLGIPDVLSAIECLLHARQFSLPPPTATPAGAAIYLFPMDIFYIVAGLCITAYAMWVLLHIDRWIDRIYRYYEATPERVEQAKTRPWFRRRLLFFSYAQSRILGWAGLLVIFFIGVTGFLQGLGVDGVLDTIVSGRLIGLFAILVTVSVLLYGKWHRDKQEPAERSPGEPQQ